MISDPVDFSKSDVLAAWEHDSEGLRHPEIIKDQKNRSQGHVGKTTIFGPHFH